MRTLKRSHTNSDWRFLLTFPSTRPVSCCHHLQTYDHCFRPRLRMLSTSRTPKECKKMEWKQQETVFNDSWRMIMIVLFLFFSCCVFSNPKLNWQTANQSSDIVSLCCRNENISHIAGLVRWLGKSSQTMMIATMYRIQVCLPEGDE